MKEGGKRGGGEFEPQDQGSQLTFSTSSCPPVLNIKGSDIRTRFAGCLRVCWSCFEGRNGREGEEEVAKRDVVEELKEQRVWVCSRPCQNCAWYRAF